MKYIILADACNVEPFTTPRQLSKINGEILIQRTVRLLKENGIKDIVITSHDARFDNLGAKRYEPIMNNFDGKNHDEHNKGYWLNCFPRELMTEPTTYLLGDVYYSENAIKTIVNNENDSILFFCTNGKLGYSEKYIKHHDEPFAFKVKDFELFKEHIDKLKDMFDKGLTNRHPIAWELYRSINGLDVNVHELRDNYIAINDETCDIDNVDDIMLLEYKVGGDDKMIRLEAINLDFTLQRFSELKNIIRKGQEEEGKIFIGDVFECTKDLAEYLTGNNPNGFVVAKVLEIIPEEEPIKEEVKQEEVKQEETKITHKKSNKKRK